MIILTIRTEKPEAEVGLFNDDDRLGYTVWPAHRQLSETIHLKFGDLLKAGGKNVDDVEGIVYYAGPGSFTGLRIGAAVANALKASLQISLSNQNGINWISQGIEALLAGNDETATPVYGSEAHTTLQKR